MGDNNVNEEEQDLNCYIVGISQLNSSSNSGVLTTALETSIPRVEPVGPNTSTNIQYLCGGQQRQTDGDGHEHGLGRRCRQYQESTSRNNQVRPFPQIPLVPNPSISSMPNIPTIPINPYYPNYTFNPYCNNRHFVNLFNKNFPVVQRFNYSTERFSNVSLFSGQQNHPNDGLQRNYYSSKSNHIEENEEQIRNLRSWQVVAKTATEIPGIEFTLMTYNVLAQDLVVEHQYLYKQHQPRMLLWENRWKNLMEEIKMHNADIICLQEVQEDHLQNYYTNLLKKEYAHLYKKRTGMRTDGCAIYYRKKMFKLIENTTVEYNQGYSVLDRDNVAIIAKFVPLNNRNAEFVIATTHLLYNPKRQDVRLAQTQVLLAEIDRIAYKNQDENKYVPIIITGDFNSEPNSAVYELIAKGRLQYENLTNRTLIATNSTNNLAGKVLIPPALRIADNCQHFDLLAHRSAKARLSRADELKLINLRHSKRENSPIEKPPGNETFFSTGVLQHDLSLQSVFLHKKDDATEGTTNQNGWITVDYIFYSGTYNGHLDEITDNKLKLLARYTIPTNVEHQNLPKSLRFIPNAYLGSDHISLLAKFKLEY